MSQKGYAPSRATTMTWGSKSGCRDAERIINHGTAHLPMEVGKNWQMRFGEFYENHHETVAFLTQVIATLCSICCSGNIHDLQEMDDCYDMCRYCRKPLPVGKQWHDSCRAMRRYENDPWLVSLQKQCEEAIRARRGCTENAKEKEKAEKPIS